MLRKLRNVIRPFTLIVFFTVTNEFSSADDDEVKLYFKTATGKLEYKYNTQFWENIPKLLASNITSPVTEICSKGTWIFYEAPHLQNKKIEKLNGITLLTTDTEQCFSKDEIGHDLGSVQHVTSYHRRTASSITFFQYEHFIGRKMLVNKAIKLTDEQPGYYTFIKSLITVGRQEWVVMLEGPTRVCFKQPEGMTLPVCLISNLIDDDTLVDSGVLQVSHARTPCDPSNSIIIEMKNCYEISQGIIHLEPSWPFHPPPQANDTDGQGGQNCENVNEILEGEHIQLIAGRLNGSLGSGEWFSAIKNPKQIWKAELFDKSFQVFSKICPDSVIDREYLLMFASLYFYHMGKVWDSGKFLDDSITEVSWMEILHDMSSCVKTVMTGDYDGIATQTASEMKAYTSLEDITGKLETMLGYRPDNDHVMEINWLMGNLVSSICTKARGFDVNFLPRYLNTFHVLYLTPIEEQWTTPGDYSTIYKYLFGGYGMHKSLTKIALCTYNAMKFSGVTEPYKRPMEQTDKILLPNAEIRAR